MKMKIRSISRGAMIAALYAALCYLQAVLIPDSTSWAIQFRVAEAMCVLAFFSPAAIPGLTLGCLLFNLSFVGTLPLDFLMGTLATLLSTAGMYLTRRWTVRGYPLFGMLMPAVCNAILVGWELDIYLGSGFWINAAYVAIGELAVLLTLGSLLYHVMGRKGLAARLFPEMDGIR